MSPGLPRDTAHHYSCCSSATSRLFLSRPASNSGACRAPRAPLPNNAPRIFWVATSLLLVSHAYFSSCRVCAVCDRGQSVSSCLPRFKIRKKMSKPHISFRRMPSDLTLPLCLSGRICDQRYVSSLGGETACDRGSRPRLAHYR